MVVLQLLVVVVLLDPEFIGDNGCVVSIGPVGYRINFRTDSLLVPVGTSSYRILGIKLLLEVLILTRIDSWQFVDFLSRVKRRVWLASVSGKRVWLIVMEAVDNIVVLVRARQIQPQEAIYSRASCTCSDDRVLRRSLANLFDELWLLVLNPSLD